MNVGALGCGSIPVIDTMRTIELDTAASVLVGYVSTRDVVAGGGTSEVEACDDRRSSSLVSDNRDDM